MLKIIKVLKGRKMREIPEVFLQPAKTEIFHEGDQPSVAKVKKGNMTLEQVRLARSKKDVERLELELIEGFGYDEYVSGSRVLYHTLKAHDPDLFKIYTGKADLWGDYYFDHHTVGWDWCPMRQRLQMVSWRINEWIGYRGGIKNVSEQEQLDYTRKMLGWPPLVINSDQSIAPLPEHLLIKNFYKGFTDKESLCEYLIECEIKIAQDAYYGWLCDDYGQMAIDLHILLLHYLKNRGIEPYKFYLTSREQLKPDIITLSGYYTDLYPLFIDLYIVNHDTSNWPEIDKQEVHKFWDSLFKLQN